MKNAHLIMLAAILIAVICPAPVLAAPDQYCGDTSLYGGAPTVLQPNVLLIVDDSGSMGNSVPAGPYDPAVTYTVTNNCVSGWWYGPCSSNAVYRTTNGGDTGSTFINADVNNITTGDAACPGLNPRSTLQTYGMYNGSRLNSTGTACSTSSARTYVTGNYVNWYHSAQADWTPKIEVARNVLNNLVSSTTGVRFGLMRFHYPGGTGSASGAEGSEFLNVLSGGSSYETTVKDMDGIHAGTTTNRTALLAAINTLTDRGFTPLGESLYEAMRYFQGGQSAFGNTVGLSGSPLVYTSPIQWGCQKNYVIFITDGMDTASDNTVLDVIDTTFGRYDGGGCANPPYTTCADSISHSLPGVAKYMYERDLRTDISGTQNVTTYTIGFGLTGADQEAIDMLKLTADSNHGRGKYFLAGSESELSQALISVVADIFSVDTSFVAPVVPVSPENRSYSGSRVYMGFFKPASSKFWNGNLKKFALDADNNILDSLGHYASYMDVRSNSTPTILLPDGFDDRDNASLGSSASGAFRSSSQSFWSTVNDAGVVNEGGLGDVLLGRTTARNIYTFNGTSTDLTAPANAFSTTTISETQLGFTAGDTTNRDKLVNFIHGQDSYDEDADTDITETREWILGDILHSKPLIVSYNSYTYTHETDCSGAYVGVNNDNNGNNSFIFVGANDGMLHAFKDCDGSEAWAFIPPDLLPDLQYLGTAGGAHAYFVDFSPSVYIINRDKSGTINPANGDKVILLFGLRRGGGSDSAPTKGYFYALDITYPMSPVFLGSISNTAIRAGTVTTASTLYEELGESWSDISVGKIKVGSSVKIAAFVGAGYDNCNEDGRFGATQGFSGVCVAPPTGDVGATTSTPNTNAALNPKGRGVYVIEIGTIDSASGNLLLTSFGDRIKAFTSADGFTFSVSSRITALDTNYDNYIDKLYVGDNGGNMWRIRIKSTDTTLWTATKIFSANPGNDVGASNGRKIFYEPSALVQSDGSVRLYFGSGDREHPLNTALVDRMYSVIDKGQTTAAGINESFLVDVTTDTLQSASTTTAQAASILSQLSSTNTYGWYIRLDEQSGEKVLAPAILYNGVVVYTTYSPNSVASADPCVTGNLGTARAYLVDYQTGNAVINFDTTNDSTSTNNTWARARGSSYNLFRSDRVITLGSGIPSGGVVVVSSSGKTTLMVGVGGSFQSTSMGGTSPTYNLYWRQKAERLD